MCFRSIIAFICLFTGTGVVFADHNQEDIGRAVVREGVHAAFHELERQLIYKYFDEHDVDYGSQDSDYAYDSSSTKPKNKNKQKGLPPGIQKKLARGGTMPPGIAKRNLPNDLDRQLPPPPDGYERVVVGNDVILAEINTGIIADILTDAVIGD